MCFRTLCQSQNDSSFFVGIVRATGGVVAETDFGQTDFSHPYWPTLANSDFGQKNLTDFGQP